MADDTRTFGQPLRAGDPEQLGSYRLTRRLGEGGMGSVYLAENADGHHVALKVIRADLADEPEFRRRFRSEVARAQEVPPFCTAEVLDADPDHETPYLVVEFVDGPSLSDVVLDRGPLTPANLHGLAIGVATALTAIHSAGVIHRDLKPSNVLLAPGSPKVIDFGIARAAESTDSDTRTDQLIGTVAYMAPERLDPVKQQPLTSAADIFAWGAVVAFAATGRVPFLADSSPATAVAILTREPDLAGLNEPLRGLVERALAKDPKDRPTARELLDALLSTKPAAGKTTAAVPAAAASEEEHLTSGMAAAQVTIPKQAKKGERTRVGAPDDVIPTDIVAMPKPRRSSLRVAGTAALVLLFLAMAGTLAAIIHGDIKLPTSAAGEPTLTPNTPPATAAAPSDSPSVTPGGGTDPFAGWEHFSESLDTPFNWDNRVDSKLGADCTVDGGLTVTLTTVTTYRCPGKKDQYTDFRATVNLTILKATSCAAIWFHFTDGADTPQGYALQICPDRLVLMRHFSQGGKSYTDPLRSTTLPAAQQLKLGHTYAVEILQLADRITASVAGQQVIDMQNSAYPTGRVVLGLFESPPIADPANHTPAPGGYAVRFNDIQIWWPPYTPPISGESASPSPSP